MLLPRHGPCLKRQTILLQAEPATTLSGLASQTASGLLSVSGVLHARQGSATSSGLLSRMHSSLNPDEAREYVAKVADLLLEFSRADTIVKSHMCSISLLIRLLQMLNKLEAPILVKVNTPLPFASLLGQRNFDI